jgi:hypothetical protein
MRIVLWVSAEIVLWRWAMADNETRSDEGFRLTYSDYPAGP